VRKRLDVLLVERGFAASRAQAQALVMAGLVHGYEKAGQQVDESAELVVEQRTRSMAGWSFSRRSRRPGTGSTVNSFSAPDFRTGNNDLLLRYSQSLSLT
jgi:hypothetical protein